MVISVKPVPEKGSLSDGGQAVRQNDFCHARAACKGCISDIGQAGWQRPFCDIFAVSKGIVADFHHAIRNSDVVDVVIGKTQSSI